jgi:hypothetical protein
MTEYGNLSQPEIGQKFINILNHIIIGQIRTVWRSSMVSHIKDITMMGVGQLSGNTQPVIGDAKKSMEDK